MVAETIVAPGKETFHGEASEAPADLPTVAQFQDGGGNDLKFIPAPELQEVGEWLAARFAVNLPGVREQDIEYFWRGKGGLSQGRPVMGKCVLVSGMLRAYTQATYVVWVAADNVLKAGFTNLQLEALVFHELKHISTDYETGRATVIGHDFEGFFDELEIYGTWYDTLENASKAMRQMRLV